MNKIVSLTTIQDIVEQFSDFVNKLIPREFVSVIIQLCATLIIFIVVARFVFKPVRKILAQRQEYVHGQIKEAEESKKRSLEYEKTAYDSIDGAKERSKQIIQEAKVQSEALRAKALLELDDELKLNRKRAEEEIEQEKRAAVEEIRKQIVDVALEASEVILNREINEKDNARLVEDFVKDVVK